MTAAPVGPSSPTVPPSSTYPIPMSTGRLKIYRADSKLVTTERRLCSVLEALVSEDPDLNRGVFQGMPWLTPVLGTGCLEVGDETSVDLSSVADDVRAALEEQGAVFPREIGDPGLLVRSFAEGLFLDRTHQRSEAGVAPVASAGGTRPSAFAGRLTLATALLTMLFHGARMCGPVPMGRSLSSDRAVLDGKGRRDVFLVDVVLPQALRLLESVQKDLNPNEPVAKAKRVLLAAIASRLNGAPPVLYSGDLRLLTEVAWLEIAGGTSAYPGWSDLLSQLVLTSESGPAPAGRRPKVTDLKTIGNNVKALLVGPTQHSWASRSSGSHGRRIGFYSAVAKLLSDQAHLFRLLHSPDPRDTYPEDAPVEAGEYERAEDLFNASVTIRNKIEKDTLNRFEEVRTVGVPFPVAYVTSFDIEMEMALWALGEPFQVVLPVVVQSSRRASQADLVWLCATMVPKILSSDGLDGLAAIRSGPHEWRTAHAAFPSGGQSGGSCPTVVRLSGCPLIDLPNVGVEGALRSDFSALGFAPQEIIKLFHALTIDEQTALRQSENELFFAASKAGTTKRGDDPSRVPVAVGGLPDSLFSGTGSNDRVWVAFGVQIDDPAIRSRMFAQLSVSSLADRINERARYSGEVSPEAGHAVNAHGLAVNERIDEDEATALHWLGFEFVLELSCGELTGDIAHCASHLEAVLERAAVLVGPGELDTDVNWERAGLNTCDFLHREGSPE